MLLTEATWSDVVLLRIVYGYDLFHDSGPDLKVLWEQFTRFLEVSTACLPEYCRAGLDPKVPNAAYLGDIYAQVRQGNLELGLVGEEWRRLELTPRGQKIARTLELAPELRDLAIAVSGL